MWQLIRQQEQENTCSAFEEAGGNVPPPKLAFFPCLTPEVPRVLDCRSRLSYCFGRKGRKGIEAPQDVCATAYWYQTLPSPTFGPLEPYADRMKDLALEQAGRSFRLDFGPGPAAPGCTKVTPTAMYSEQAGVGN